MTILRGYKTYLVAAGLVAYGLLGFVLGDMAWMDALKAGLEGAGLGALRAAVSKV